MIGALITGFKVVKGFTSTYKWVVIGIAVAGMLGTVFLYIDNHGEMKATVTAQKAQIENLMFTNGSLEAVIIARNATIVDQNLAQRALIEANKRKIEEAQQVVIALRLEREILTEELGVLRFETIEAIRDDEDFADWVDWDVPIAGWSLLRIAAEGE
jgi:hypothetical protein